MADNEVARPIVVVGVDGSTQSGEALRWAARYAALIGGELRAVIAWDQAPGFGFFPQGAHGFEQEALHTVERIINKFIGTEIAVGITPRIVQGNPASVLVTESTGAHLLVVGDRGYGGFVGLLLGSVGENCVRHAKCSVIVVRDGSDGDGMPAVPARGKARA